MILKFNIEQKQPNTEEYMLCNYFPVKFKTAKMMLEVRIMYAPWKEGRKRWLRQEWRQYSVS